MLARRAVRPLPLAALAAACAGAFVAIYVLLLRTYRGQRLDERAIDWRALATRPARDAVHHVLASVSVGTLALVLGVFLVQAIARRRTPLALVAALVVVGAALCSEALKLTLPRPTLFAGGPGGNTFPSGHTTIAFAIGVAATLIAPARWRPVAAAAAVAYGAAMGIAVVAAGWHRPSDVAGALLVVTGWTALVALASAALAPGVLTGTADWPHGALRRRHVALAGIVLAAGYVVAIALVLARRGGVVDWTLPGRTFLGASAAIAALAVVLMLALLAALRGSLAPGR